MSKKTSYLLGILLTIIIGTLLYCYLCDSCQCLPSEKVTETETQTIVPEPEVKSVTRNGLSLTDNNGNFDIKINDNFNFKTSNFSILEPLSEKVTSEVTRLKDYLAANPLKTVDIIGYYKGSETNDSAFPNLGLARANSVKNYLVSQGIASQQINTEGKLMDDLVPDASNILYGPLEFGVLTAENDNKDAELEAACAEIRKNPIILYFNTAQAQINLTEAQRKKIAIISRCVDKLGLKVQSIGHTDSDGSASTNMRLGQNRADFAKEYLIRNGILAKNINAISKGETAPIANNNTNAGKKQNRRTVITIN